MRHCFQIDQPELESSFKVPSGGGFIALLEAFRTTGGTLPGEILARLLHDHPVGHAVSLATLIGTGHAFGFKWRNHLWIPMFQFDANNLCLNAGAQIVRDALPLLWSDWTIATWFAASNAQLDGRCPADLLGPDIAAVVRAAQSLELDVESSLAYNRQAHKTPVHV